MKKCFLIAIALFGFSVTYANNPEKVEALSAKVILLNTNGYFALSDGSFWKVISFSKRWRTLTEWWNNVQLVPKNYECVPNDWFLGSQIEVYSKVTNLNIDEADAANQEDLRRCTHLLINSRTGQVLFAIALEPADCLVQLFNEAHEEGYNKGFNEGRMKGNQNATDIYNSGRAAGYRTGYAEGFQDAKREPEGN